MPWSTAFRIPTNRGTAWSKATGPGPAHEGRLLATFAAHGVEHILYPIAADHDRAWLLFDDGGDPLRSLGPGGTGDRDLVTWERVLRTYAGLQRAAEPWVAELVTAGVPDARPVRLPGFFLRLLDDDAIWDRAAAETDRRRLRSLRTIVEAAAGDLAASGIAPSIDHGDLHGRNVLIGPGGDRIFDWGDSTVAHPFATLATTLPSIARRTGLPVTGPDLGRLRDGYLEAWTDVLPSAALAVIAERAMRLAPIAKAAAWERALEGLTPDAMGGHDAATAESLHDLVEPLV
jgi:Phosphotransferase enzyme family